MGLDRSALRQLRTLLHPLRQRVAGLVARGVVKLVNDASNLQLVQLGVLEGETVPDGEHHQPYGFSSIPLAGAEAVVLFQSGDRGRPLVVAVSDRRHRPTGGEPGEVTVYHHGGAKVRLLAGGNVEVQPAPGGQVLIREEGGTTDALVKRSEFLKHGHSTAGTGPPSAPIDVSPLAGSAVVFPGTAVLKAE